MFYFLDGVKNLETLQFVPVKIVWLLSLSSLNCSDIVKWIVESLIVDKLKKCNQNNSTRKSA